MKYRMLVHIATILSFFCCSGQGDGGAHPDDSRLTCIVPGHDSIIYYYGNSTQIHDVKRGKISDTAFVNDMFHAVKERGLQLALKPGDGPDVLSNFREVVNLLNDHEVTRQSIDTLDVNEQNTFGYTTPPSIKEAMEGQGSPLKLNPSREETSSRLVILLNGDNEIYIYPTEDIRAGKKYTYPECREMLNRRKSGEKFSIMIRPSASSTYRNTVHMLDEMKTAGIRRYALIDITKEEEDYLRQIYQ